MSQPGERSSPPSRGEEGEESVLEDTPLTALAPDAGLQDEGPSVQISASPAFQCLDELFSVGKISGNKVARLKASYSLLHDTLKSSQESEIRLLQEAKRSRAELERQRRELEKEEERWELGKEEEEEFPEGPDTEVGGMRRQLLQYNNDLRAAEEREYQMTYQLECLQEEKASLEKECDAQPKPVELEKQANFAKALKDSSEELRREVAQRRLEVKCLREDMEARQKHMHREERELDDTRNIIETSQAELAQLLSVREQLGKEIERMNHRKIEVERRNAGLEEQVEEQSSLQRRTEERSRALEQEIREVVRQLEGRRALLVDAHREHNMLLNKQAMTKEKETLLMEQRGMLDINLGHVMAERKSLHETLGRNTRENDRELRGLKKVELQLKLANDELANTQLLYDKTKLERDATPNGDGLLQKRKELEKEVENLKQNLIHQQSVSGVEGQLVEQCFEQEQQLVRESHRGREDLHTLHCLTQIKADERDQKNREVLRAEQRFNRIKQELRGRGLVVQEHKKQFKEIQSRLSVFTRLYDMMKGERNKYVKLHQLGSQSSVQMREKFRMLNNQIEITRTMVVNKDKLLQKSCLKHAHSRTVRDHLRNDISQLARVLQETQAEREEQKLNMAKLTHMINQREQDLLQLRSAYEAAVQRRNDLGVQLLEREGELCIYYEKVNIQEDVIRKGNMAMQTLEEEKVSLQMVLSEETRQLHIHRKLLPCKRSLEEESTLLQIQLSECKDRLLDLTRRGQENRARELQGNDPSPEELMKKIEQLEVCLAECEEQLLEKELVYKQVTRLCEQIRAKAENGEQETLELAKKVNEVQGRVRKATREAMAEVAELAMRQAEGLSLQRELKERQLEAETCRRRLDQGLPPSDGRLEEEWRRMLRDQQRRRRDQQERERLEEEEMSQLPSGVYTAAEARPTAYVPHGDSLLLSVPYGALAPFKPSEPGTNIRHIRKPQPKPIEL